MIESKLFNHKIIKINGVRFAIRKLSPSLFLDKDYLFPMSSVIEKNDSSDEISDREMKRITDNFKDKMKDVIEKSVVYVKSSIFSKQEHIKTILPKIMEEPELYSYLFTLIVNHSLGQKKNYSRLFKLTEISLEPST